MPPLFTLAPPVLCGGQERRCDDAATKFLQRGPAEAAAGFKMKHAASQDLYDYWNRLRGGRSAPERADIDPAAIRTVLADTLMLEIQDGARSPSRLAVRLSGTRVNALFTEDIKGRDFMALWKEDDRSTVAAAIAAVLADVRPAVAGILAAPAGRDPMQLELLLLPLRHKGRTHARMMAALSPIRLPDWLGLVPVAPLTMTSHRMIANVADTSIWQMRASDAALRLPTSYRSGPFVVHEGGVA